MFRPKKTVLHLRMFNFNNHLLERDQMIRAMYDSRRLIRRFAHDDSHKNGDDSRTDGDDLHKRDFFVMYLLKYLLIIMLLRGSHNLEIRSRDGDPRPRPHRGRFYNPYAGRVRRLLLLLLLMTFI